MRLRRSNKHLETQTLNRLSWLFKCNRNGCSSPAGRWVSLEGITLSYYYLFSGKVFSWLQSAK